MIGKIKSCTIEGKRLNKKESIDKHSECCGELRDKYGFIFIDVSQFNRGLGDISRRTKTSLKPIPDDFKESSEPYENADLVLALFNPAKYSMEVDDLGFPVTKFINSKGANRYRSIYILKNSYGEDDLGKALHFVGEVGAFSELPKIEEFNKNINLYNQYNK